MPAQSRRGVAHERDVNKLMKNKLYMYHLNKSPEESSFVGEHGKVAEVVKIASYGEEKYTSS